MNKKEIIIKDEHLGDVIERWSTVLKARQEIDKLNKKVNLFEAEKRVASIKFWDKIEELYPETSEGNWNFDDENNIIKPSEEKPNITNIIKGLF